MSASYEFGPFRLDAATGALHRNGEFVPLTPKMAQTLQLLVEEAGRIVTKEQLLDRVWPGVVVEEGAIANNISSLRKVLAEGFPGDGPIATLARRGYRFIADVRLLEADAPAGGRGNPAAPVEERGTILVGDFENRTGDPIFDGTLRQALGLHLAQSPYLEVLNDRKLHSVLSLMGRTGQPVLGEVALEVCTRTNAAAAILGSIFVLGEDYVLGLQAVRSNGEILVTEQARAHGKAEVLNALDQAAIGMRAKLGESRLSVQRFGLFMDETATTSLEALKAYTTGREEWFISGELAAKRHYLRAIELDPSFASAYSALAICCDNMGQISEARRYMTRAYELRARTTEYERLRLEAGYHQIVTGDRYKTIEAQRLWARLRPNDMAAIGNMGGMYALLGQWDRALDCAQRAVSVERSSVITTNLVIALMALGRNREAHGVLEDAFGFGMDAFYLHLDAYHAAFLAGDESQMARHVAAVAGRAGEEDHLIAAEADTAAFRGEYERARELNRRAIESARRAESREMAACWEALGAVREALIGETSRARVGAKSALALSEGRNVRSMAAFVLASTGDDKLALEISDALIEEFSQDTLVHRYWLPCMHAALAMNRKGWKAAIDALEPALAIELGQTPPFEGALLLPPYLRGLAMRAAGRKDEAARELAKIVERPGLAKNFVILPLARHALAAA